VADPAEIKRRVLAAFRAEYPEQIAALRAVLESWPPTAAAVEEAFRLAHSMKGGARVCDLEAVEATAHTLESLLAGLTKRTIPADESARAQLEILLIKVEDLLARNTDLQEPPSRSGAGEGSSAGGDTLRVHASHLDRILQSNGQLLTETVRQEVIQQELREVSQELQRLQAAQENEVMDRETLRIELRDVERKLNHLRARQGSSARSLRLISSHLQEEVGRARMVTIGSVLDTFPKMVRDLALEEGKKIHLRVSGQDQHVDRLVLQSLRDPIMHALRNAIAHGIESAGERASLKKPDAGQIEIIAEVNNSRLKLRICDDGKGPDVEQIRRRAIEAKILTEEKVEDLKDEDIINLVFRSGFSTAKKVSTLSGRGMGLSVVKQAVSQLQGTVSLRRREGGGSILEIEVPVSISAHRLLIAKAGGRRFALPVTSLHALHRVQDILTFAGEPHVEIEGRKIALLTSATFLGGAPSVMRDANLWLLVALIGGEDKTVALNVEAFEGEITAFIKPLPFPASLSSHFSGGVILEDGSIALVVNIADLLDQTRHEEIPQELSTVTETKPRKAVILVVDDSFTARTLQKSILEAEGFSVRVATDGENALSILRSESIDAVISDIQMPRIDGFQLLTAMKSHVRMAEIPVVLVTSLSSKEDQERGLALGADAYIIKERFDHRQLLTVVRQLV